MEIIKGVSKVKIIVKRISTMMIVGLIVTIGIYPILHELGHSIVAYLFGAKVLVEECFQFYLR